ncbi:MAG: diadenylate cyclase, partial [bacterium]
IGHSPLFAPFISGEGEKIIPEIVDASFNLAQNRIGGLIVIEREIDLGRFKEVGKQIGAKVSSELIQTIFTPHSPLHDGAIIIRGDTILSAGAMLPLSINPRYERFLGTRHRAAIGVSEQTDALAIVISEETGQVSFAMDGNLRRNLSKETLENYLRNTLIPRGRGRY